MTKKILTVMMLFMIVLLITVAINNVNAIHSYSLASNIEKTNQNNDVPADIAETKKLEPNLGNAQYSINKAPAGDDKLTDEKSAAVKPAIKNPADKEPTTGNPSADEEQIAKNLLGNEGPAIKNPAAEEPITDNPSGEKTQKRIIDPNKPMIALTYDDGPSLFTSQILDVLKENNSAATFFILGSRVNKYKDVLNRMLEEGSQIGNHSYNHKNLTKINDEELYKQIQGTDDLVFAATGHMPSVMRPPYGASGAELNKKISRPIIKWSIDTRDWENKNTEMINKSILEHVKDGDIVLMHDLYDTTAKSSKTVIPELIKMGYQLVTIEELFQYRDVTLSSGEQYFHMHK